MPAARKPRCAKKKYRSRADALRALRGMGTARSELRAYPCGKHVRRTWHLTSSTRG